MARLPRAARSGGVLAGALLLATTSASAHGLNGRSTDDVPPPGGVPGVELPALDWAACPEPEDPRQADPREADLECATAEVPLNYAEPDGDTVTLAVARKPAAKSADRKGSVLLNRGGPGYSAIEYLSHVASGELPGPLNDEAMDAYDVIALDPRGSGQSTPQARCFERQEDGADLAAGVPTVPRAAKERVERARTDAAYARECSRLSDSSVLPHLTSVASARDMDVVRAALREEKLNFVGQSYGTYLGSVYANLFPERTGRMVFDSVLDPTVRDGDATEDGERTGTPSSRTASDLASEQTLREFLRLCADAGERCVFGDGEPKAAFQRLVDRLERGAVPLRGEDGEITPLTWSYVIAYTGQWLYQPTMWGQLGAPFLRSAAEAVADPKGPDAAVLAEEIRAMRAAGMLGGPYGGQNGAYHSVACAEIEHPDDHRELARLVAEREPLAPHFAALRAYTNSPCVSWAATGERYEGPWDAADTEEPILVVGNRYDPATPLWSAKRLHATLPHSALLVNEGSGHIAAQQSTCVRDASSRYLLDGTTPGKGDSCEPDQEPFAEAQPAGS